MRYDRTDPRFNHKKSKAMMGNRHAFGHMQSKSLPTIVPSDEDIVLAAGWYEGEGCPVVVRDKSRPGHESFRITIVQKDRWILERLREHFGGSVGNPAKSGVSNWNVYGNLAMMFCWIIYPYLSPRRQNQIRKCLNRGGDQPWLPGNIKRETFE